MDARIEQGVLAFEFDDIRKEGSDSTMVQVRRSQETNGRIVKILGICLSLVLILTAFLAFKSKSTQVPTQAAVRSADLAPMDKGFEEPSEGGSRTFEFELATLDGLDGSKGSVIIKTMPQWAPLGVQQFHGNAPSTQDLIDAGFYQNCRFFRVVPNFMVQFGISGDPTVQAKYLDNPINDDPVEFSNNRGIVTFATSGPNSRTTQLFINTANKGNAFLDKQGFAPIAQVLTGMDNVDKIYDGYREKPVQNKIINKGNEYLENEFPKLSWISSVTEIMH